MSIHVALNHVTEYEYDRPINLGPQVIRLRPAPHCRSNILSYSIKVEPDDHFINWQQDPFANYQARLVFPNKASRFKVTVDIVTEMAVYNPFDFFLDPAAEKYPFIYNPDLKKELLPYLGRMRNSTLNKYLKTIDRSQMRTIDFLVKLNQKVQRDINYLIRMEPGVQTPDETIFLKSGSCRDSAWLLVNLLRLSGLAARFVSGYLIQLKADLKALDGPSGTEIDFTDLHAWCEVYLPGAGWIGLDPTSGLLAGEGHIPVACTPEPNSAAPIEGEIDECEVEFKHSMAITRIYESPRVTKPYTSDQWLEILDLGKHVDQLLITGDVRLTMGGEPTFVAVDGRDAREWNIDALGPTKRAFAADLLEKLREKYGEGGFLHFGQGKWYPGEQLPRWALSIYWRADGHPVWNNPSLFADERDPIFYTSQDAEIFITALSRNLGLDKQFITPAYEDVFYYLWRESKLPVNVDPFQSNLEDEMERTRLKRIFTQKLDAVIGYVLPIEAENSNTHFDTHWKTGPWLIKEDRLYLLPGDSPMGYRLPLDSLPWVTKEQYPYLIEQDPFSPRSPLPSSSKVIQQNASLEKNDYRPNHLKKQLYESSPQEFQNLKKQESATSITRTALCVEARDPMRANGPKAENNHGKKNSALYIFMPPFARLEDYLNLLYEVEKTAQELNYQIILEGYPPPRDPRLKVLQVTPDPGVIEVNIHPAFNWEELVSNTEFLYQAAFESRLSAEKFMTDGRHTGTGGGNHFVMGGASPNDSPFIRRPELLASLILYWHNHPSLSYLFSGMFIGPTSQAPRVDEARNDQLYELEIALKQIQDNRENYGEEMPPWIVDRTLRNILIDVTGNTHRSEFCIDKMYSPDSQTGRLGLLELRAFEMPPHAHMSIVQQLLIRALIARFWDNPYIAPITRWGTELHYRYILPTFITMDFDDVIEEMQINGFAFKKEWFLPHLEFRFPLIGKLQTMGTEIILRHSLEPWHVMGEENSSGGTARYVDSSLERIEVRVTGLNQSRYTITCNGRQLPLQPSGTAGEYIAGVRYKAWNPPSSLHPSIAVHVPLIFDIIDTWMGRSIGGCQYHVTHPGGTNYDNFPINAFEAESRRLSRFFRMGHTPGLIKAIHPNIEVKVNKEFPFTLDMRL
jgi:uncharacterized protein (DUF2126 family)/transglutaminase-like putative cysteine protease